MANEQAISAATDCFLQGADHLVKQGFPLDIIINSLISAALTCCYRAGEQPDKLKHALRQAANQVPALYEQQDRLERGKVN